MNHYQNLLDGDIKKNLVNMTYSISLGFISIFTFSLIDTFFIAQLGSKQLSALGFVFPMTFLCMNIFFGLNTGITSQVGKSLGKRNVNKAKQLTLNSIGLIILFSLIISYIGYISTDITFRYLGADDSILVYIKQYLNIWYLGFVFLTIPMALSAAIRGSGDAKTPSKIMFFSGLINGILDPILIFGFGPIPRLEVTGAILATVISWFVACLMGFYTIIYKTKLLDYSLFNYDYIKNNIKYSLVTNIKQILSVGLPSAATYVLTPLASVIIMKIVALNGYAAVAGFGVGMRLEALAILFSISLSIAIVPFVSINHGAKNHIRINNGLKYAFKLTFFSQMLIYIALFVFADLIAMIFSNDPKIINIISLYLRIIPGGYCFVGVIMIILSTLNAIEHAKYSTMINIIRFFIFSIPCAFLGQYLYGIIGILIGIVVAKIISFGFAIGVYKRVYSSYQYRNSL